MKLRARIVTKLPATLNASGGFKVVKSNGVWTFSPDWPQLTLVTSLTDPANQQFWSMHGVTGVYTRVSAQAFIDSLPPGPQGEPGIDGTNGADGAPGATGPGYAATSTSSQTIGNSGTKTFTVSAGLAYSAGARVRASDASNPATNWMEGVVSSYSSTTLEFTADKSAGSGTLANWTINLAGQPGADGAGTGDVTSNTATSVDSEIALYNSTTGKQIKRASTTGVLKATSGVLAAAVAGTDYLAPAAIGVTVQGYDADTLKADVADNLEAGFTASVYNAGTQSSGTYTPNPANGNLQRAVNGGAHTLAPPSSDCTIIVQYTNNGSAGAVTTSGFTKIDGSFTTTNGDDFMCYITRVNSFMHLNIVRLQ